jgi:hypothetical protein
MSNKDNRIVEPDHEDAVHPQLDVPQLHAVADGLSEVVLGRPSDGLLVLPQFVNLAVVDFDEVDGRECCDGVLGGMSKFAFLSSNGRVNESIYKVEYDDGWDTGG